MHSAKATSSDAAPPRRAIRAVLQALTWRRAALAVLLAVLAAAVLNPVFSVPFAVLAARMVFIAAFLLLAFGVAGAWQPRRMPPWLTQVLAVVVATPIATLLAYLPSVGGDLTEMLAHEGRVLGFLRARSLPMTSRFCASGFAPISGGSGRSWRSSPRRATGARRSSCSRRTCRASPSSTCTCRA